MPLQFSSDFDFIELDIRLAQRRAKELSESGRLVQPSEVEWITRKLTSILEVFDDGGK